MRRAGLTFSVLLLTAASAAAGPLEPTARKGDLDGDAQIEVVTAVPFGAQGSFQRTQVRVHDFCMGQPTNQRVGAIHDSLERLRLRPLDGRDGSEIFYVMRDGARSALGEARVIAWRLSGGADCRRPKDLFDYDTDRHTRTPRGGTGDIAFFTAHLRNASRRFPGLEIVLEEWFSAPGDPPSFGSIRKKTFWRYSSRRDSFVPYDSAVTRRPAP